MTWRQPVFCLALLCGCVTPTAVEEAPQLSVVVLPGEYLIADGLSYPFGIGVADFDGDGDVDVTVPDIVGLSLGSWETSLYLYQNHGDGLEWTRYLLATGEGFWERHAVGDVDRDGALDVVMGDNIHGGVLWLRSELPLWDRFEIVDNLEGNGGEFTRRVSATALADFDQDGWLDAVVGGYDEGLVALLGNPGAGGEWGQFNIDDHLTTTRMMQAGDIDGDGWTDVVASSEGIASGEASVIAWWRNPGQFPASTWSSLINDDERRWVKHVIDDYTRAPGYGNLRDMDLDGDLDVVIAFGLRDELAPVEGHHVAWYENPTWIKHDVGLLHAALDADAGDFDGDGDMDIAAVGHHRSNQVVLFERDGAAWLPVVLKSNWTAPNMIVAADMDGDGVQDIVAVADDGNGSDRQPGGREVRWWRR